MILIEKGLAVKPKLLSMESDSLVAAEDSTLLLWTQFLVSDKKVSKFNNLFLMHDCSIVVCAFSANFVYSKNNKCVYLVYFVKWSNF